MIYRYIAGVGRGSAVGEAKGEEVGYAGEDLRVAQSRYLSLQGPWDILPAMFRHDLGVRTG